MMSRTMVPADKLVSAPIMAEWATGISATLTMHLKYTVGDPKLILLKGKLYWRAVLLLTQGLGVPPLEIWDKINLISEVREVLLLERLTHKQTFDILELLLQWKLINANYFPIQDWFWTNNLYYLHAHALQLKYLCMSHCNLWKVEWKRISSKVFVYPQMTLLHSFNSWANQCHTSNTYKILSVL